MIRSIESRIVVLVSVVLVGLAGCQARKGGGVGSGGAFPENGLAEMKDKLNKGKNALDHELAKKVPAAMDAIAKAGIELKAKARLSEDVKLKVEEAAKAAGFESIDQLYDAYDDLVGARHAVGQLRTLEQGGLSDFQKAVMTAMVEEYTEADLRLAHELK